MKKAIPLSVNPRAADENAKHLRKAGEVPCVVYGNATKNTSLKCNAKELHGVYVKAGENTLVELELDGKKTPCLIHAISFDPVTSAYEHVDFFAVNMTKKVTTRVPIVFRGESPAVKALGGVLLTVRDELEVSCLPSDIPSEFIVDLSVLENFRDSITVGKLDIPAGVTIEDAADAAIVIVQEPRKEEVIEPVVTAAEGAVPVEGAAAEGTAPAAAGAKADDKVAGKDAKDAKKPKA